jgi:hypothetical protein
MSTSVHNFILDPNGLNKPLDKSEKILCYIVIRYIGARYNGRRYNISFSSKEGLMKKRSIEKHLPLTESTYYILLALKNPRHCYHAGNRASQ